MKLLHKSVEWGWAVSRLAPQLLDCSWVLPDLPNTLTPDLQDAFWATTTAAPPRQPEGRCIQTLAVNQHSPSSWIDYVASRRSQVPANCECDILVVGGNDKPAINGLGTPNAIQLLRQHSLLDDSSTQIWAVSNPNDSHNGIYEKLEAGATGIMTQPLLTSTAWSTLSRWRDGEYPHKLRVRVGLALPASLQSLLFWQRLLQVDNVTVEDPLFRAHVEYFSTSLSPHLDSGAWARREHRAILDQCGSWMEGIHYMPMSNTRDLLPLLRSEPMDAIDDEPQ